MKVLIIKNSIEYFFFNEAIIVWSIRVLNLFNNEWKIKLNQFN